MTLTLEALYALHILNGHSEELFFLPLLSNGNETRANILKKTLEKGWQDLRKMGLLTDEGVTDEGVRYGLWLLTYHQARQHVCVNDEIFCATDAKEDEAFIIVIERQTDGGYLLERLPSIVLLAILMRRYPLLKKGDATDDEGILSPWRAYAWDSVNLYYRQRIVFRLRVYFEHELIADKTIIDAQKQVLEYDHQKEQIRDMPIANFREFILKSLQVRYSNG